jgi:hypothetical protein
MKKMVFVVTAVFFLLDLSNVYGQKDKGKWQLIQENVFSYRDSYTFYYLRGDFEGDYFFKIQPKVDGFLTQDTLINRLETKRFVVIVYLRKSQVKKLRAEKINIHFYDLQDKQLVQKYYNYIENYFMRLDYTILDPDNSVVDYFPIHFFFVKN